MQIYCDIAGQIILNSHSEIIRGAKSPRSPKTNESYGQAVVKVNSVFKEETAAAATELAAAAAAAVKQRSSRATAAAAGVLRSWEDFGSL